MGIVDADPSKHGKKIGDFQIYSPQDLNVLKPDAVIFAIKNRNEDIYPQIQNILKKEYPNIKLLPNAFNFKTKRKYNKTDARKDEA